MAIDFLIVGGGIGGAVLANLLGERGKRVLVLDKNLTTPPQTRPEVLWPATVEVLRALIPRNLEKRWLLPLRGLTVVYRHNRLLQFGPEVLQASGVQPCSTANTRELLLQQAPCEHQRGVEVTQVLRDQGRVVGVRARDTAAGAERDILAEWTVGDDGPHSTIRHGCGVRMHFVQFPVALLGFRFDWPARLPANVVRIWINQDRLRTGVLLAAVMPLPEGQGVGLIPAWPETLQNEKLVRSALRALAASEPVLEELIKQRPYPEGYTHFHIAWGRTPRFGVPGALLMGDAAHPVTPAGGQGANSSVADALAIAAAALQRPKELLAEYQRHRSAATQRSLAISRSATRFFSLPPPVLHLGLAVLPWAARWLNKRPERFGRFLWVAAEAFRERNGFGEPVR